MGHTTGEAAVIVPIEEYVPAYIMGQTTDETAFIAPIAEQDRRKHRRVAVSKSVRVSPSDAGYQEEIRTTLNASPDDLYFTTWAEHYVVGMSLSMTFPYASVAAHDSKYEGEVVRIDRLKDSRLGIAVRINCPSRIPKRDLCCRHHSGAR
jgi:hypothetical protein